ncbi:MAG TPA: ribonuclease D [Kiloniellales bacterium]|nr:ribonuclease D [Kiloniellales bacterium]
MTLITETDALEAFCASQAEADYIAVDTEFMRDSTYWPRLCLVQVAGPEEAAAIDALAPGIELGPLYDLLKNKKILKVFHSARQDMEIFHLAMDRLPEPIFDTQVAAMVCGFGESVGYDTLVRKLTGTRIDKSTRFADWSRRPLKKRQVEYALSDVIHLRPVYEKLRKRLERTGRTAWLDEEMAVLTAPETYRLEPETAWQRLKTRSADPRYLAVLQSLAAWREAEAQRRDVPRNRVLRDEQLFDIAAHRPRSPEELAQTRGVSGEMARGRLGREILAALERALALPEDDLPPAPPRAERPAGLGPVVDLLKVLLKMKCEEHEVAQKLVASSADLEVIAADDEASVPALSGWRFELFGRDALALKHGRLALGVEGKRIRIVPLGAAERRSAKSA